MHVPPASAASFATGFVERQITNALNLPTSMQFAPDGRLFVCEQDGTIRMIKDDTLLDTPVLQIPGVHTVGERGFMGLAFDPEFAQNGFIYAYYTVEDPIIHNRVSRFTVNGDQADPSSEVRLLDMDDMSGAQYPWHVGGALNFGADGYLYVSTGDNTEGPKAQSLSSTFGKILRIDRDGNIPADNPFYSETTGIYRAIWALGLRNPFTGSIQPGTGLFLANDVGQDTWEEINEVARGANFGWPDTEGMTTDPRFTSPIYTYIHNGSDCAITGSAFYNPAVATFPSQYVGKYFFADYCSGWIRILDPQWQSVEEFASGIGDPTDLKVSPSGSVYYLLRSESAIMRVDWSDGGGPVTEPSPIDVPGELQAEDATSTNGLPAATGRWLMSEGDFVQGRFTFPQVGTYQFSIKAAGEFADGAWPQVVVTVDGSVVGSATVDSASVQEFVITAPAPAGTHAVGVEFPNDFWDGVNDRNLFIDSFSIAAVSDSGSGSGSGSGDETSHVYSVRSLLTDDRFMDVYNQQQDPGTPLIIWTYNGNINQRFDFRPTGEIVVYGTMCLATRTPDGADGDEVAIEPCSGQPNQVWRTTMAGEIRGIGDRCLDVWREITDPGTKLIVYPCHGGANQQWELVPAEP